MNAPRRLAAFAISVIFITMLWESGAGLVVAFPQPPAMMGTYCVRPTDNGVVMSAAANVMKTPQNDNDERSDSIQAIDCHQAYRRRRRRRPRRRSLLVPQGRRTAVFSLLGSLSTLPHQPEAAGAMSTFGGKERRQLDYCLVNLLRVTYWAESLAQELATSATTNNVENENKRRQLYLEARLGAKALVTGKVGGGGTNQVYQLSTLQFRACLDDIAYYAKSRQVSDLCQDLVESVAAMVEFDGLETTMDPSPRSSLTLSMYNPQKATYVQRLLSERIIPICKQLFASFDSNVQQRCIAYVTSTYPNEVPRRTTPAEAIATTSTSAKE